MIQSRRIVCKEKKSPRAIISFPDNLRFGCEFEFYISGNNTKEIIEELESITGSDILINLNEIPIEKDSYDCLCLKYDSSLTESGVEISTPICSYDTLRYYIGHISWIIEEYGTTNEDTGFHIHISMEDKENMDFYALLLLFDNANLLDSWGERNGYSLNPMEILNCLNEEESKKLKDKKGRIWSIERRGNAHIEIRTIGGVAYHKETSKIYKELDLFIKIFQESLEDMKLNSHYEIVLENHFKILNNTNNKKIERFQDFISTINPIVN